MLNGRIECGPCFRLLVTRVTDVPRRRRALAVKRRWLTCAARPPAPNDKQSCPRLVNDKTKHFEQRKYTMSNSSHRSLRGAQAVLLRRGGRGRGGRGSGGTCLSRPRPAPAACRPRWLGRPVMARRHLPGGRAEWELLGRGGHSNRLCVPSGGRGGGGGG